jgi:hypothetical protein
MDPFRAMTEEDVGLPLEAWNYLMAMARRDQQGSLDQSTGGRPGTFSGTLVEVKNLSGGDRARGEVLGIDGPLFPAADALSLFTARTVLKGIRPAATYLTDHVDGRFVILLEPIPAGKIGWAAAAGIVPVRLDLTATWHFRADIVHNDPSCLRSYPGGAAQIVAVDRSATGLQWAYVRWPVNPIVRYCGTLDADLAAGGSATMNVYHFAGGWTDADFDATVYTAFVEGDDTLDEGTRVQAEWNPQAFRLEVTTAAESEVVEQSVLTNVRYDSATHAIQVKTRTVKAHFTTDETGWTTKITAESVTVQANTAWSSPNLQKQLQTVYLLGYDAAGSYTTVDTAEPC